MRRLVPGVVLFLLGWVHPAAQDHRVPPLERLIDTDFNVRQQVSECTVANAVVGLARRYEMVAVIEYPRAECARMGGERHSGGDLTNLRGMTVGQAIDELVAMDPRYRVVPRDGVVVIRPVAAWADATNVLNFTSASFAIEDTTLGGALDAIVAAISGVPRSLAASLGTRTEQGARKFSVKTGAVSAGEALEAIVRAHGAAYWIVRESQPDREGQPGRNVFFHTFDGTGIGTDIRVKP